MCRYSLLLSSLSSWFLSVLHWNGSRTTSLHPQGKNKLFVSTSKFIIMVFCSLSSNSRETDSFSAYSSGWSFSRFNFSTMQGAIILSSGTSIWRLAIRFWSCCCFIALTWFRWKNCLTYFQNEVLRNVFCDSSIERLFDGQSLCWM